MADIFEAFKAMFSSKKRIVDAEQFSKALEIRSEDIENKAREIFNLHGHFGIVGHSFAVPYTGEQTPGELDHPHRVFPEYWSLRLRSWQSFLESEITQTLIKKYVLWTIGQGLKLESEPDKVVLAQEGIDIDVEDFSKQVESRFRLYAKSKQADWSKRRTLNRMAFEAKKNAMIGGDVVVVMRFDGENLTSQLIDGHHVQTPPMSQSEIAQLLGEGNIIRHGVELNERAEHVAYHIITEKGKFERVPVMGSGGRQMAFMVYGMEYRIDDVRGVPLISAVMETIKSMDRYRSAAVGAAEERQKMPFTIEHGVNSTGENPLLQQMRSTFEGGVGVAPETATGHAKGDEFAQKIATTTKKQAYNLPIGASLKSLKSENELFFKDFYTTNFQFIAPAIGIPPEVALSLYSSNFSASRAALKDWEHTINVDRDDFSMNFYQPIFNLWMEIEVLKLKIVAPGFLQALRTGNQMAVSAYLNARWVGKNVPHIDPLKEVQAERLKLGDAGKNLPLTTAEAATEALNGGDFAANSEQYANELEMANFASEDQEPELEIEEEEEGQDPVEE